MKLSSHSLYFLFSFIWLLILLLLNLYVLASFYWFSLSLVAYSVKDFEFHIILSYYWYCGMIQSTRGSWALIPGCGSEVNLSFYSFSDFFIFFFKIWLDFGYDPGDEKSCFSLWILLMNNCLIIWIAVVLKMTAVWVF